jgi:small conductance mechanosensitive channel
VLGATESLYLQDLGQELSANWVWVLVAALLAVLAIGVLWLVLSRWVERFLRWLDTKLPGDFSSLHRPLSRTIVLMASGVVLLFTGLSISNSLGLDTSGVTSELREWGLNAGQWLLARLARILLVIGVAFVLLRLVGKTMPSLVHSYLGRRAGEAAQDSEIEKRSKTLEGVILKTFTTLVLVVVVLMVLSELGVGIGPVLAGAGVVGIAVGFGAQNLIRDYLAGVFVLLEDQYRVGDVVRVAGVSGVVEDFNLRRTVLRDLDLVAHSVPNGEIRVASNMTKEKSRANIDIEVAYKEDLDRVMAILNRIGEDMYNDPALRPLMNEPLKALRVDAFRDSGITIKVLGETKPMEQWAIMGEFRLRVKRVFDQEGIEIPFPHRTIYWGKGSETVIRQPGHAPRKEQSGDDAGPDSTSPSTEGLKGA